MCGGTEKARGRRPPRPSSEGCSRLVSPSSPAPRCGDPLAGSPSLTQSRHSLHLGDCVTALARYSRERRQDLGLAAEQLRLARRHLDRITGHVGAEDVLDIIFRDFCVGK